VPPNPRRVALLRGINVGRNKRVAMAELRAVVEQLGYRDVRTLLNSGNVVFTLPAKAQGDPAARIEQALAKRLGITSRVTVLTADELAQAIDENPLAHVATNPSRLLVHVLYETSDRSKLTPLTRQSWAPEAIALGMRVVYLWCPEGILESRGAAAITRALGDAVTARNWATMTKLHALTATHP